MGLHLSGSTTAQLNNAYAGAVRFDAEKYKTGSLTDKQALAAACAAATSFSTAALVQLSSRTWDVGTGFSMSGYSCGLEGVASGTVSNPGGSVIYASSQSGPVLDLNGWTAPNNALGRVSFGNFAVRGSGTADATKANIGIRRGSVSLSGVRFHDITVTGTGGPCIDLFELYLSDMERITLGTPVSAKANDVAYMILRGCNGNRFLGIGFRSILSSADVGASGALIVTDDGTFISEGNQWLGTWFEFLHVPTNGTLIYNKANQQSYLDTYFVDCSKESGATGTSYVTFAATTINTFGGNEWRGFVPGHDSGSAVSIDTGISVSQSNNRINGVKGFNGANVTLNSGAGFTFAQLGGRSSSAGNAAFVDNSAQTTNVLIDAANIYKVEGNWLWDIGSSGPRIRQADATNNGTVALGAGGTRLQAVNTLAILSADQTYLRNLAATRLFNFDLGTQAGVTWPAHSQALPTAGSSYEGKIVFMQGAAGAASKMWVCLKSAADTYSWVQVATG